MVVHRAQVQPDRYAINIDVQEQPPIEQMKTVQRWRQALRSKLAFGQVGDPNQYNSAADFTSYYNALALDTIIYLAQPKGFTNAIEKLPGTPDVPDVYDIELLTDLFYSIIGMPRAWFGGGGANKEGGEAPSGKALLAQDIRFLRKIKSIRRPIINTYQWLGYFHAVLKGKNIEQLDIKAMMPPIGSLEEQMKLEMLQAQAEVLDLLADVMDKYRLPKEAWIETIFKRYMHLPDDVVNAFITALPGEIEQQQQESKKSAPFEYKLLREIDEKLADPVGTRKLRQLREIVYRRAPSVVNGQKRMKLSEVIDRPQLKELDVVVSSFGKHPFELKRNEDTQKGPVGPVLTRMLHEGMGKKFEDEGAVSVAASGNGEAEPYYRRWIKPGR